MQSSEVKGTFFDSYAEDNSLRMIGLTPLEYTDFRLFASLLNAGCTAVLDLGRDEAQWPKRIEKLQRQTGVYGIRIPEGSDPSALTLPSSASFILASTVSQLDTFSNSLPVITQVVSIAEAKQAIDLGASGLILKGSESGGRVGVYSAYILLQQTIEMANTANLPVWVQGGIGINTTAAAIAGGAYGVVLDSQLSLLTDSTLPASTKAIISKMDGSEVVVKGEYAFYSRPQTLAANWDDPSDSAIQCSLGFSDVTAELLPIGQDAALAAGIKTIASNAQVLVYKIQQAMSSQLSQAKALQPLASENSLAKAHGTRYPIAQGPMTRVSDRADFAKAVADNGALPFIALSLMSESAARSLVEETAALLKGQSWGIGVLGFADAEILDPHLALVKEFKPDVVLIAGGRPSQARALEELGIQAYLHVPAPGLLEMFLKDGARNFVFEGRECGGHVGPRSSFALWEQQLQILATFENPQELQLLFAGGIHDERSAAMVAAMISPLAALGAKVGVLMGTAYTLTDEAVESGAIIQPFQDEIVKGSETTLLETAPGHATRCLNTPFVDAFNEQKQQLKKLGVSSQEIWSNLEKLNVGRLRIASKGIEREGDKLVSVEQGDQLSRGMYMIGDVATMRDQTTSMAKLHASVTDDAMDYLADLHAETSNDAQSGDIAIIGMACVFPGSPDIESFWLNIIENQDLISEVDPQRWNPSQYFEADASGGKKTPSKWGGFISDTPFDPLAYGIPPQSVSAIEPVQLLSLEVAKNALIDAGYGDTDKELDRERTSVIFGAESGMDLSSDYNFRNLHQKYLGDLPPELDDVLPKLTEDSFPGVLVNVIAGRIANRLDLRGVNYAVDSACASSLTAVELAVKELRAGTSDTVLAGGADFHNSIHDYLMFASVGALSASGKCRSFDNSADGIALGEGVAVVVLKRLEDAERDGDRIYATINGIAGSSDGKSLGLTAPRKEGQKRALERAYLQGNVSPADIGLVEAHGTGTVVGDKTEMQTLTEIYSAGGSVPGSAVLGSVKSQIGHTKCAAGLAGLIKVTKSIYHKTLPPTGNIETPNAYYQPNLSPFTFESQAKPWLQAHRKAAVSAFGFGGANFHAVLSSYDDEPAKSGLNQWPAELFLLRGDTADQAKTIANEVLDYIDTDASIKLRDLSYTLASQSDVPIQCSIVAGTAAELQEALNQYLQNADAKNIFPRESSEELTNGKVAFLFPGQGSQTPGMMRDLFQAFPALQDYLNIGEKWQDKIFPASAYTATEKKQQQANLTDTRVAQPAMGIVDSAAASLLETLGVSADMVAGHSYGELVALAVAGVMDTQTLLELSEFRGQAILNAGGDDPGSMAAVSADAQTIKSALIDCPEIVLANHNSPTQTVISGPTEAIEHALSVLDENSIAARKIEVACAFHSPVVAAASHAFADFISDIEMAEANTSVYSNTTAKPYPLTPEDIKARLAQHISEPVRFVEQLENMYDDGARLFIEVGPGRTLSGLADKVLKDKEKAIVSIDEKGQPGIAVFLKALGQLIALGKDINIDVLFSDRDVTRLDLANKPQLPATTWMINGYRAYPINGALPDHAAKPSAEPVSVSAQATQYSHSVSLSAEESTMVSYLQNMREMVNAQRDVMLGMMGQQPVVQSTAALVAGDQLVSSQNSATPITQPAVSKPVTVDSGTPSPASLNTTDALLSIVSDRTGYPQEMLDVELDLEADLSIDSIKRVEIIGELASQCGFKDQLGGDADEMLEQLASQKTLQGMIDWLAEKVPTPSGESEITATSDMPGSSAIIPEVNLKERLLGIVSDRTGYPEDVLDLDLDLEADLSIDSIKRVEIVTELSKDIGISDLGEDNDLVLEQLAARKTLREMLDWLEQFKQELSQVIDAIPPTDEQAIDVVELCRYTLRLIQAEEAVVGDHELAGKHFLITDDGLGIATALTSRLMKHDASVTVIPFSEHDDLPKVESVDGLIHLWGLSHESRLRDVKRLFDLIRNTLINDANYLLLAGGLGGSFGSFEHRDQLDPEAFGHGAGMSGLVKTIVKEWPEVRCHWVDLNLKEKASELAAYIEVELLAENPLTEVGYHQGTRQIMDVVKEALPSSPDIDNLELNKDSVVMLTGGARGITAKLAVALAGRYGCRLELVGRSPLPTIDEPDYVRKAHDLKSLRAAIINHDKTLKPLEVEKQCSQILAAREINTTFAAIEAAGSQVKYHAVDVRDIDAFADVIESIYDKHGRLDGVIHGAGILEDKLLRHKTNESFERVFDTKVRGALVLSNHLRDDVKFVVFFSSVASAFGNRGQIDYAAANDALDKIAHSLQARVKGRVLSVNWGPWAGTGMVSEELERQYASKGIGLIPLDEGVDALINELRHGNPNDAQIVLMCATPESIGQVH